MIYRLFLQLTFALLVTSKFVQSTTKQIKPLETTSYACPDFFDATTNETIVLSTCTGCDLCGDGSVCPACDSIPLADPSASDAWICANYFNPLTNQTVSGEACSNCNLCGDGSICPACPDLATLAPTTYDGDNTTFVPTSLITSAPTSDIVTSTPTVEVTTASPTEHVPQFAICPDFYDSEKQVMVIGLGCSDCQYCGDILCPACKTKTPINQPSVEPTVSLEPSSGITSEPSSASSEPTVSYAPTIDVPQYAICPDFFDPVLNSTVSGLGCSDCQWCGDKLCPACRTKKPSIEPTFIPTSEPTPEITSTIGTCPDFYLDYNLVSGEACTGCELCGDGSTCPVCADPESIEPEGVCPTYVNDQSETVQGETCKGCTSCGDGSVCVVCPSYLALIGATEAPTIATSVEPSVSLEPTMSFQPSIEPTISIEPTSEPSSFEPTISVQPSMEPTISFEPTISVQPSMEPTISIEPTVQSTNVPSSEPTVSIEPSFSAMPSISSQPTGKPSTASPSTGQPTASPSTASPSTGQPTASPSTASPSTGQPTAKPSTSIPSAEPSISSEPTTSFQPTTTDQPASQAPISGGGIGGGSNSNTLNAGAAAGIAVGGFVFAVLCLGAMLYVCFFMGKDKKNGKNTKRNNTNKEDVEFSNVAASPGDSERRASFGISSTNLELESARSHSNLMV